MARPRGSDRGYAALLDEPANRQGALRWRILRDGAEAGPRNMALDHALAACLEPGEGVLRLYRWCSPTVSFGRNEPACAQYDPSWMRDAGLAAVRRPSGGRAVLHQDELTYAVVVPARSLGGSRAAHAFVREALLRALRSLGVAVAVSRGSRGVRPDAGPCFFVPAPGEIVVQERKLVGSAQVRLGGALLEHGSILLSGNQVLLRSRTQGESRAPGGSDPPHGGTLGRGASSLEDELGRRVGVEKVCDAVVAGFGFEEPTGLPGTYRDRELEEAARLEGSRYAQDAWTWRR